MYRLGIIAGLVMSGNCNWHSRSLWNHLLSSSIHRSIFDALLKHCTHTISFGGSDKSFALCQKRRALHNWGYHGSASDGRVLRFLQSQFIFIWHVVLQCVESFMSGKLFTDLNHFQPHTRSRYPFGPFNAVMKIWVFEREQGENWWDFIINKNPVEKSMSLSHPLLLVNVMNKHV